MFDWTKPTVQMLGRWQPWHEGHSALFERALSQTKGPARKDTGQVCIMVRDVPTEGHASDRLEGQDDNPFDFDQIRAGIIQGLQKRGYTFGEEYIIIKVPNIVNISYGRGVGYTFIEHDLGKDVHDISATKIREEMREKGELETK
jgi:hypothetical protein|tara:strand:- start:4642 stop:5076 length:435 start_codon:yes stop_codon:yes gene_type:complete